jgi:Dyp-type peroxidase family
VLYTDPFDSNSFGSYMAFVKIRQDLQAFEALMNEVAGKMKRPLDTVKAWVVGRTLTGEPLERDKTGSKTGNNFNFTDDPAGNRCPLAAHIRKVNPRDPLEKNHQILRRGVVYGDLDNPHKGEGGLLFQCFQSSLEMGFEYIFRNWARNPNHPSPGSGPDPFLGDGRDWPPVPEELLGSGPSEIRKFTQILYGEYFYFPSIRFFSSNRLIPTLSNA